MILCQLGFGIVTIIGISPDETQIGDIVVELMHNKFGLRHKFGWRCGMEQKDGYQVLNSRGDITSLPTLHKVSTYRLERQGQVPRLSDIWIPIAPISPNHFVRFYILGVEDIFCVRDRILKVENIGLRARLISWKACQNDSLEFWW